MTTIRPTAVADAPEDDEEDDPLGISKEVVRAIRNMAKLTEQSKNGRRVRTDPAKELAQQLAHAQELCIEILTRMDLLRRRSPRSLVSAKPYTIASSMAPRVILSRQQRPTSGVHAAAKD